MDKRFLSAFRDPASKVILGRRLFPFCLKHRVRLLSIDSPLVTMSRPATPADLLVALNICAEASRVDLGFWGEVEAKLLERQPEKYAAAVRAFVDHCHLATWPKYWDGPKTKDSADGVGVPWPLMILTNLIANGIEEQRAWEMPEAQAIWLSTAFAARGGAKVELLTTEEEEMMEELRRAELPPQQG